MQQVTLVVMAAGIGSRFDGGIKQLQRVGPNGELIIDYSISDALQAGFTKVVFIIRKDLEADFKALIGDRIAQKVEVAYAYQEIGDVPEKYQDLARQRKKPWGTGQAVLCCKDVVNEPFLVINADDYYGKEAYQEAYRYLTKEHKNAHRLHFCMVGYVLEKTLSENGGVTRGLCEVRDDGFLKGIYETANLIKKDGRVMAVQENYETEISPDSITSMNMWGLYPGVFEILEQGFDAFLESLTPEDIQTKEYLLPNIIEHLVLDERVKVKVLYSKDNWFGFTYREDKDRVVKAIRELTDAGLYDA